MAEPKILISILRESLGVNARLLSIQNLHGGSVNHVVRVGTNMGDFCLKLNKKGEYPGMFEQESLGLKQLFHTESIRVPEVISHGTFEHYQYLLLEYLDKGVKLPTFWEDFGRELAILHQQKSECFGNKHDNYIGSLPQSNASKTDWTEFFITERIEKQLQISSHKSLKDSLLSFDKLFNCLTDIFPDAEPSLLHGDLWKGNFVIGPDGRAALVDPAVYYGHPEMELAFTVLFGGFDKHFYKAYTEIIPEYKDFEKRADIYNLYPLLVHMNLFGKNYLGQINSILSKYQ